MVREWNDEALSLFLTKALGKRLIPRLGLLSARTIPKALREEIKHYETFKIMFEDKGPVGIVLRSLRRKSLRNITRPS